MFVQRLFIYGSLQPGGPNEHLLTAIGGEWEPAFVTGKLVGRGWGATMGYPGLVLDAAGTKVHGQVFSSSKLNASWDYLDEFEGDEYNRVITEVTLDSGERVQAYVYVLCIR